MEEVVIEVMQANETSELFQIISIENLNMGNLTLEVNNLKNRLTTKEKEKAILHEELEKEKIFRRDINIMWKFGRRIGHRLSRKLKCSLRNYKMRMRSSRVAQHG